MKIFTILSMVLAIAGVAQADCVVGQPCVITMPPCPSMPASYGYVCATLAPTASASPSPTPSFSSPSPTPTPSQSYTGSTAAMQAAGRPGVYGATTTAPYGLDGHNLVNNQLLDDAQAAALVMGMGSLPASSQEAAGSQTRIADSYYQNANPASYAAELANWKATQTLFPADVAARVDGAIPIANPTFLQANAWAALKWGLNPSLGLGEAMEEDNYSINDPGDVNSCSDTGHDMWGGCSTGFEQVADRGANHGWPGLITNNLAAESTAFHMDFFYMHYYAIFNGLFTEWGLVKPGDIVNAIQYWCGSPTVCPNYSSLVLGATTAQGWFSKYYGSHTFTVTPPSGTTIPQL